MARLYADEDFDYPVVELLRSFGHDVLTAQEAGQANQCLQDTVVLAYAIAEHRAVLTFNRRHFIRLHRHTPQHVGIIVCTRDDNCAALASRIHDLLVTAPDLDQQLFRVKRPDGP